MNDRLRQVTVGVLSLLQLVTNAIGGAGINGQSVGTVSDNYSTAFIPAGLTFSVWGPIYIGLTAYAIYQSLPGQKERAIHRRVGWLAALAAAGNAIWTPLWVTQNVTISLVVMFIMLSSLAAIFVVLRNMRGSLTVADQWAVMIPFSGYFAWITVATVANVTTTLIAWGWNGAGIADPVWSIIGILAAILVTVLMITFSRGHAGIFAYTGVLIWAFVGVYLGNGEQYAMVGVVALAAAAIVTIATALRFWRQPEPITSNRQAAAA